MLWKQFRGASTFDLPSCGDPVLSQAIVQQSPTTIPSRAQPWVLNTIQGCRNSERLCSSRVARIDAPDELPSLRRGSLISRTRPACADGGMHKHQLVIGPPARLHFSYSSPLRMPLDSFANGWGTLQNAGRWARQCQEVTKLRAAIEFLFGLFAAVFILIVCGSILPQLW